MKDKSKRSEKARDPNMVLVEYIGKEATMIGGYKFGPSNVRRRVRVNRDELSALLDSGLIRIVAPQDAPEVNNAGAI